VNVVDEYHISHANAHLRSHRLLRWYSLPPTRVITVQPLRVFSFVDSTGQIVQSTVSVDDESTAPECKKKRTNEPGSAGKKRKRAKELDEVIDEAEPDEDEAEDPENEDEDEADDEEDDLDEAGAAMNNINKMKNKVHGKATAKPKGKGAAKPKAKPRAKASSSSGSQPAQED